MLPHECRLREHPANGLHLGRRLEYEPDEQRVPAKERGGRCRDAKPCARATSPSHAPPRRALGKHAFGGGERGGVIGGGRAGGAGGAGGGAGGGAAPEAWLDVAMPQQIHQRRTQRQRVGRIDGAMEQVAERVEAFAGAQG